MESHMVHNLLTEKADFSNSNFTKMLYVIEI